VIQPKQEPKDDKVPAGEASNGTNAILVTGAFHARELLSMQVPLFMALKLIH